MAGAAPAPLAPNAFVGRKTPPSDADLATALGPLKPLWDQLTAGLIEELELTGLEWKSYGAAHGWSARLQRGTRNIVHVSPCVGCIRLAMILGDRAVAAARADATAAVTRLLDGATRYPEGTGLRLELKNARLLPTVKRLARIKLAH